MPPFGVLRLLRLGVVVLRARWLGVVAGVMGVGVRVRVVDGLLAGLRGRVRVAVLVRLLGPLLLRRRGHQERILNSSQRSCACWIASIGWAELRFWPPDVPMKVTASEPRKRAKWVHAQATPSLMFGGTLEIPTLAAWVNASVATWTCVASGTDVIVTVSVLAPSKMVAVEPMPCGCPEP